MKNEILHGDALSKLKEIPSESVDSIITSPPYWALRDYKTEGTIWDGKQDCEHDFSNVTKPKPTGNVISSKTTLTGGKDKIRQSGGIIQSSFCSKCNAWKGQLGQEPTIDLYINHLIAIFDECKRVLKKSGTCWVVLGDTICSNFGGGREGSWWSTKTKQDKRTQLVGKYPPNTMRKNNIPVKSLCMIPERFAIKMIDHKWILRNKIIWHKKNCMPSSAKDRFTIDYEYIYFFTKSKKYYFKTQYEPYQSFTEDPLYRKQLRMNKKYNPKEPYKKNFPYMTSKIKIGGVKHQGNGNPTYAGNEWKFDPSVGRIKRCVWTINTRPFSMAHFAVFPEALVQQCLDAGCPPDGICLDPFLGSGTTALVALKYGRSFLGIELNKDYIEIANKRLERYLYQEKLPIYNIEQQG